AQIWSPNGLTTLTATTSVMASTVSSPDQVKQRFLKDGFVILDDSSTGEHMTQMQQRGFPYLTEWGLEFLEQHVLSDKHINESFLGKCVLVHWLRQRPYPEHILCYTKGGPTAGRRSHHVHLIAEGSIVNYRNGSLFRYLQGTEGKRSINEIPSQAYDDVGCPGETKEFPNGGKVILDSRVGFELIQGYVLVHEFAREDLVEDWVKMEVPSALKAKAHSLESEKA
ncbi:hypothetical protein CEP51_016705, partial [Fusarium floridanum]